MRSKGDDGDRIHADLLEMIFQTSHQEDADLVCSQMQPSHEKYRKLIT
jgi:hypothetical protein